MTPPIDTSKQKNAIGSYSLTRHFARSDTSKHRMEKYNATFLFPCALALQHRTNSWKKVWTDLHCPQNLPQLPFAGAISSYFGTCFAAGHAPKDSLYTAHVQRRSNANLCRQQGPATRPQHVLLQNVMQIDKQVCPAGPTACHIHPNASLNIIHLDSKQLGKTLAVNIPVWIFGFDFPKTFAQVDWAAVWFTLSEHGVSNHMLSILETLPFESPW